MGSRPIKKKNKKHTASDTELKKTLRHRAANVWGEMSKGKKKQPPKDFQNIIHELEIHQIELEMQNEELRRAQAELDESRLKYIDLYDFAPVGYFTLTPKGIIKSLNMTSAEMLGATRNELVKKRFSLLVHEDDADSFYLYIRGIIQEEARLKQVTEVRLKRKNGTVLHVQLEGIKFSHDGENVFEIWITATDITERIQNEEALRQLARFPAENPFPVIRASRDGIILYANRASAPLLAVWEVNVGDLLPEEIGQLIIKTALSGTISEIEQECEDKIFSLSLAPISGSNFVNIYANDITERKKAEGIIQRNEAQLKATLSNINEGVIVSDLDGQLIYWNPAAVKEFGFSAEEEYLHNLKYFTDFFEISTPEEGILPLERWPLSRVLQGETLRNWELNFRRLDTDWQRIFNLCGTLARDRDGNPLLGILTLRDITERRAFEEKIKLAKREWEKTFDSVPDLIAILDMDNTIQRVNKAMAERVGLSPKELIGKKCFSIMHETSTSLENCPHTLTTEDSREHSFEVKNNGDWLLVTTTPLFDSQGNLTGVIHVARDITELKNTEKALQKSHEKLKKMYEVRTGELKESEIMYSTLVEALLTGVYVIVDEKIVFTNRQFAEIFGYKNGELLNKSILDIIHPKDWKEVKKKLSIKAAESGEFEIRGVKKNGDTVHLLGVNTVVYYGGRKASLGNISDITKRKNVEREKQKLLKELGILSAKLLSTEELERKRIAGEIHDSIGQALSAIKFSVENSLIVIENGSISDAHEALKKIVPLTQQTIEEVRKIVMDLRPSILDDLGLKATISWFCREFVTIYDAIHVEPEIGVEETDIPEQMKTIIYRILQEAFNNAAKHSRTDHIRLTLEKSRDRLVLLVADKGCGFDVEEVFARAEDERGMGLASMRERAMLSGGRFSIRSKPGGGTEIKVSWPPWAMSSANK